MAWGQDMFGNFSSVQGLALSGIGTGKGVKGAALDNRFHGISIDEEASPEGLLGTPQDRELGIQQDMMLLGNTYGGDLPPGVGEDTLVLVQVRVVTEAVRSSDHCPLVIHLEVEHLTSIRGCTWSRSTRGVWALPVAMGLVRASAEHMVESVHPLSFGVMTTPNTLPLGTTVDKLFATKGGGWNEVLIRGIFWPKDTDQILALPEDEGETNVLRWHYEKHGRYSFKSAYHLFTRGSPR
ncbi:hypothetical protein Salat_0519000 [Sesamum alatum]|uniref:Uncharacterized protein n=1 Tax=Sesamum alatum TaxID=300844 RepID=A0AAE1Z5C7_9LAMI|nr:hypothetical protein Salat_0519000 [Sesamum alatum]